MKTLFAIFALFIASAALCVRAAGPATSAAPTTAPGPAALEFSVHPAAIRLPALQYHLIPGLAERTPGDAAPLYLAAFLQLRLTDDEQKQIDELLAAPREKFSAEQAGQIVQSHRRYLATVELASLKSDCHWEIPWREHGIATLLPHLQPCRQATRLLALQARMQIGQGRFNDAVHTLQSGFALVNHLKNDAVLIQGLVAIAMTNVLLDRVVELEQTPGSPNLYWALAGLPHPLVDMRAMAELERTFPIYTLLPELKGRNVRDLSAEDFSSMLARIEPILKVLNLQEPAGGEKFAVLTAVAQQFAPARAWLQSHGYTEKQVNDLPPISAVGIYLFETYQQVADDMAKWTCLPYWQAKEGLAKSDALRLQLHEQGPNPVLDLLPGIGHIIVHMAAIDRRIAMLQTVEALRDYAAGHGGKLPPSLADLSETPAPIDPMTGKPFDYEVSGNSATLRSLAAVDHILGAGPQGCYRITLTGAQAKP